jgi:hypothetical protein
MEPMTVALILVLAAIFAVPCVLAYTVLMKMTRFAARSTHKTIHVISGIPRRR